MDETQAAPPADPQQPVEAAPPAAEQAQQTTAPETPTTDAGLMRAYTQATQKLSAVASALGIAKTSTPEQFVAAINERRQAIAMADAELEQDPRLAAQAAALRAREERFARQTYGASADLASTLMEAARAGGGILELAEIVDQAVIEAAASRFAGATPAPAGGSPAPAPQVPPGVLPQQAPERTLAMDDARGNAGMFVPGITPDREKGPGEFFKNLREKVNPALRW